MTGCNPFGFDAVVCGAGIFDAIALAIANWYFSLPLLWIVVLWIIAVGVAYKQGGLPAALAVAFGFGFLLGRRKPDDAEQHEHVSGTEAGPSPRPRKPVRKSRVTLGGGSISE